jgi:acetoin utilization deacetylase AcuC-like enzyme/ribosomal protein S18 acetylase RimI-like enzyme
MHEAGATVAAGSLRAMEQILGGRVQHAFHPGGGLHHAMRDRASGFCIYNDPALAIARARADGRRVLYLDFDVHHGDGVQELFIDDPGVLTFSIHESGRYLFPGTGFVDELGTGRAAGTSVNVPLEPDTGETAWLAAIRSIVPLLGASFGPDILVTQHGCDSHAVDPLAHLRVTTTAMGEAARLSDAIAERFAAGRWLSTGGGGYAAYRVVPRAWSLVWLAGAHQEAPTATPAVWRERWAADAGRFGDVPLPEAFADPPNAGLPDDFGQERAEERSSATADLVARIVLPALVREAVTRDWWDPLAVAAAMPRREPDGPPEILAHVDVSAAERLTISPRVVPVADPSGARALILGALIGGARLSAAVAGEVIIGVVITASSRSEPGSDELLALGVAPDWRRRGIATRLLAAHVEARPAGRPLIASVTVAERDWVEPLAVETRAAIARRLLEGAGFRVEPAHPPLGAADRWALTGRLG